LYNTSIQNYGYIRPLGRLNKRKIIMAATTAQAIKKQNESSARIQKAKRLNDQKLGKTTLTVAVTPKANDIIIACKKLNDISSKEKAVEHIVREWGKTQAVA
jgi:hypothetical protein